MQRHPPLRRPLLRHLDNLLVTLLGAALLVLAWLFLDEAVRPLLIGAVPVYLGVLLPRIVGRDERLRRVQAARERSVDEWGFCSRDRNGPWINYIDFPLVREAPLFRGRYFYSEWLVVHDGRIVINPGPAHVDLSAGTVSYDFGCTRTYAWDGCSPKVPFFWMATLGTPDWWEHLESVQCLRHGQQQEREMFWPVAHHASLVHDALYQFLNVAPVTKAEADELFHRMLLDAGMPRLVAWVYRFAVVHGGARDMRRQLNPNTSLRLLTPLPGGRATQEPLAPHKARSAALQE
ncbi:MULTISPECIES: DUF1353 domain-containing protein [Pseudomonas]|uniref:DUF1353 domain-containing protein n=1 Tax=Pseudomonas nitroreducens TaxID=46680 RepID=A0A6G6J1B2_PSENT|nr:MULTISPECIES: DUF1353 domain-containing protein [Pseudomonas]NMZ57693.1 DUF1353 domain-containing protein [Pseudomonas nitroreducens]OBY59244.1 hypothetical protein A9513_008920 [Pseudomonas sp. AU12215]QIE88850.1 DUF1353 domain-containing protein [Pseudomonas nitroreducens]WEW97369.1 DUF1353 domain-containing protein [Pseudomonas nitroreducens]SNS04100.1 Protein of unknown function [Pseudomonas nitroreducens]